MSARAAEPPAHCLWCQDPGVRPSPRFRSARWPAWECPRCDVAFVWPLPSPAELAAVYQGYGNPEQLTGALAVVGDRAPGFAEEVLAAPPSGTPSTLLDVGCSDGRLLGAALARGWIATGIELDRPTAEATARRLGVTVHVGPALETMRPLGRFGAILTSHVLEHLPDPRSMLTEVRRHLVPGGLLIVRVPNGRSRAAAWLKEEWNWFRPPLHLGYFSLRSFEVVAPAFGFEIVRWDRRLGDAHLFPTEIALAALRRASGDRAFQIACEGQGASTALAMRLLRWLDAVTPGAGFLARHDDSELDVLLRWPGDVAAEAPDPGR